MIRKKKERLHKILHVAKMPQILVGALNFDISPAPPSIEDSMKIKVLNTIMR